MLYALVAVFAACAGYAAGRLHQWYRMDADREEAYQAGYDAAARSTFTMAARMAGRDKSAVRASASVHPAQPAGEAAPGSAAAPAPGGAGGRPPGLGTPFPVPKPPVFPPVARPAGGAGMSGPAPGASASEAGEGDAAAEDVSDGVGTESGPAAGSAGKRSKPGRPTGRLPRRGRHLVPQELVRAATYRLSPDRVARAKVPGALPLPGVPLPGEEAPDAAGPEPEQPVKPTVPKPRGS